jgi:ABC-type polysaccharide/polyol phosphate export permease
MYPKAARMLIEIIPLTQAIEGLRNGGVPIFEIAYVWTMAAIAMIVATRMFEKNMHL